MMELAFIIKVISTVIVAAVGWVMAHYFTSRRDLANKRREIKTQYLIEAYRKIDSAIEPEKYTREWCELLEGAFSEIQLFGTEQQIKLAHKFAEELLSTKRINHAVLTQLLQNLRASLRSELNLADTVSNIGHIRIYEIKI